MHEKSYLGGVVLNNLFKICVTGNNLNRDFLIISESHSLSVRSISNYIYTIGDLLL